MGNCVVMFIQTQPAGRVPVPGTRQQWVAVAVGARGVQATAQPLPTSRQQPAAAAASPCPWGLPGARQQPASLFGFSFQEAS
jgi:hypothetical protein